LIERAFGGDDELERDFAKEKEETHAEETVKRDDTPLPGWGSWVGEGIKNNDQTKELKTEKTKTSKDKTKQIKRQDDRLKNVIIDQKRDKKFSKYRMDSLPHPFVSKSQFDSSTRMPIGTDWNTSNVVATLTAPKVSIKPGIVLPPIKYLKPLNQKIPKNLKKSKLMSTN